MDVIRVLKLAFLGSLVAYAVVAFALVGAPDWSLPLVPQEGMAPLFFLLSSLAVVGWLLGLGVGRMNAPPPHLASAMSGPWPKLRFVLAAALVESGALFGLVLTLLVKDSRYALLYAAVSAALVMMLPTRE
ncbi:MAG: hypothetical protein WBS54_01160 [Acidobacteriota bacterium]